MVFLSVSVASSLMPAILSVLRDRKDLLTNELHLLSAITALQRVTETLHHFISPYLQDVTSQVSGHGHAHPSGHSGLSPNPASVRPGVSTHLSAPVLLLLLVFIVSAVGSSIRAQKHSVHRTSPQSPPANGYQDLQRPGVRLQGMHLNASHYNMPEHITLGT